MSHASSNIGMGFSSVNVVKGISKPFVDSKNYQHILELEIKRHAICFRLAQVAKFMAYPQDNEFV